MSYNTNLQKHNVDLQSILDTINNLPEVGTELPELTSPAAVSEVFFNKQTIDSDGNILIGTFTIDSELDENEQLLEEIRSPLAGKAAGGGSIEPTLQSKTVSPSTNSQTVKPDSGYDGLSSVIVNAIPNTYVEPIATRVATTYIPTTSNQTIAAGTYCSGTQTIKGDSNLVANNIKSGVSIFGVNGTYVGSGSGSGGNTDIEDALISGSLTTYENARVVFINNYMFCYNMDLTSVNFPACEIVGLSAFEGCESLTSVNFPVCTNLSMYAFAMCHSLTSISLPACELLEPEVFLGCAQLTSIYLTGPEFCTLWSSAVDVFRDSGITPTTGYIYVNPTLLEDYKADENWSYLSDRIFAYEG